MVPRMPMVSGLLRQPRTTMTTTATTLPSPLCIRFWHGASVSSSPDASAAADAPLLRTPPRNIAVLGGGITGLATAYFLRRELPDDSKITLYEASDRFGGWIETTKVPAAGHEGGAMIHFERGPRMIKSLNSSTVRFDDLALFDILKDSGLPAAAYFGLRSFLYGKNGELIPTAHVTKILRNATDRPARLMFQFLVRRIINKLPPFLGGVGVPAGDDVSLTEWVRQQLGSTEVVDSSVSAILHGMTGGNPDTTSMRELRFHMYRNLYHHASSKLKWRRPSSEMLPVMPQDRELLLAATPASSTAFDPRVHHYALNGGMQTLTDWMATVLSAQNNTELKKGTLVTGVRCDEAGAGVIVTTTDGKTNAQSFDAVVSTIPSQLLAKIAPPSSLPSLEASPSVSIQTVNLWYPSHNLVPPKSVGYLIPTLATREQNPYGALGVIFDSEAVPPVMGEPSGTKLFVLLGGHHYDDSDLSPPADDATAIQQARETVHKHLGIPLHLEPGAAVARLAKDCLPQFTVGHSERMVTAHRELLDTFSGKLCVAGPSYRGMGVLGGARAGWDTAMRLAGRTRSDHVGDTGLAGFERMAKEGLMPDVFVPRALIERFRSKNKFVFVEKGWRKESKEGRN